jgi:membrane protein required for colicin V production
VNWLDYILIAILLFSVVNAARKGFSREIVGLVFATFAFLLGMWFYGIPGSFFTPYTSSVHLANMIGFLIVVLCVLICGAIAGWIVSRFVRSIGLSFFDRLLGAGFGFVRGVLIAMAVLTAFMAFGPYVDAKTTPSAVVQSRIAPYVLGASRAFVAIAPMELKSSFRKQYSDFQSELRKNLPPPKGLASRD